MIKSLQSIPVIFKTLLLGVLMILMLSIVYPVSNHILGLFDSGMMKIAAVLGFWLIVIFVTWFLLWIIAFKQDKEVIE